MSDDKRGAPTREAVEAMIARLDHLIAVRPVMQWGGVNSIVITVGDAKEAAAMLRSLLDAADAPVPRQPTGLQDEIRAAINRYSAESESNTPDWILADFLMGALDAFDGSIRQRERWYGRNPNASPAAPAESAIAPLAEPIPATGSTGEDMQRAIRRAEPIAAIAPDALLPCPFCGAAPILHPASSQSPGHKPVQCTTTSCPMSFLWPDVKSWNQRAAMRAATGDDAYRRRRYLGELHT